VREAAVQPAGQPPVGVAEQVHLRVTGVRGQVMPPDALITSPVTQRESSEARNTAALARSSGLPSRPSGVWATN
jgi:hypothetical protein